MAKFIMLTHKETRQPMIVNSEAIDGAFISVRGDTLVNIRNDRDYITVIETIQQIWEKLN